MHANSRDQVRLAVSIQIDDRDGARAGANPVVNLGPEAAVAPVAKHGDKDLGAILLSSLNASYRS